MGDQGEPKSSKMSTTTVTELRTILKSQPQLPPTDTDNQEHQLDEGPSTPGPEATNVATAVPDGGYGWVVVTVCALLTFWFNGIMASWGVLQAALLRSNLKTTSTSTISFVGTLGLATVGGFWSVRSACDATPRRPAHSSGRRRPPCQRRDLLQLHAIQCGRPFRDIGSLVRLRRLSLLRSVQHGPDAVLREQVGAGLRSDQVRWRLRCGGAQYRARRSDQESGHSMGVSDPGTLHSGHGGAGGLVSP